MIQSSKEETLRQKLLRNIVAACACAVFASVTYSASAAGAHAAAHLDALHEAVELTTANEELTPAQRNAVTSASKTLNRSSTTPAADLKLLAKAATALNPQFIDGESFEPMEEEALDAYAADAREQLEEAYAQI